MEPLDEHPGEAIGHQSNNINASSPSPLTTQTQMQAQAQAREEAEKSQSPSKVVLRRRSSGGLVRRSSSSSLTRRRSVHGSPSASSSMLLGTDDGQDAAPVMMRRRSNSSTSSRGHLSRGNSRRASSFEDYDAVGYGRTMETDLRSHDFSPAQRALERSDSAHTYSLLASDDTRQAHSLSPATGSTYDPPPPQLYRSLLGSQSLSASFSSPQRTSRSRQQSQSVSSVASSDVPGTPPTQGSPKPRRWSKRIERLHNPPKKEKKPVMTVTIGDRVIVNGTWPGVVRYVGGMQSFHGTWVGVELDEPGGTNDGKIMGRRYFECKQNRGLFVRKHQIAKELVVESQPLPEYVAELQTEYKELIEKLASKASETEELKIVLETVKSTFVQDLATAQRDVLSLREQLDDSHAKVEELTKTVVEQEALISTQKGTLSHYEASASENTREKVDMEKELINLRADLSRQAVLTKTKEDELARQTESAQRVESELTAEINTLREQLSASVSSASQREVDVKQKNLQIEHFSVQVGQLEAECSELKKTIAQMKESDKLRQISDENASEMAALNAQALAADELAAQSTTNHAAQLKKANEIQEERIAELQGEVDRALKDVSALKRSVVEKDSEIDEIQLKLSTAERKIGRLQTQMSTASTEDSLLVAQVASLSKERDALRLENMGLTAEKDDMESALSRLQSRIKASGVENPADVVFVIDDLKRENAELKAELQSADKPDNLPGDSAVSTDSFKVQSLERKVDVLTKQIAELRASAASHDEDHAAALQSKNEQLREAQTQAQELEEKLASLRRETATLKLQHQSDLRSLEHQHEINTLKMKNRLSAEEPLTKASLLNTEASTNILEESLERAKAELESLRARLDDEAKAHRAKVQQLEAQLAEAAAANAKLKREVSSLQTSSVPKDLAPPKLPETALPSLPETVESAAVVGKLEAALSKAEARISTLETEKAALEKQIQEKDSELSSLRSKLGAATATSATPTSPIAPQSPSGFGLLSRTGLVSRMSPSTSLNLSSPASPSHSTPVTSSEVSSLKLQLASLQRKVKSAETQRKQASGELAKAKAELEGEIRDLKARNDVLQEALAKEKALHEQAKQSLALSLSAPPPPQ